MDHQLNPYIDFFQTELERAGCKQASLEFYSIRFSNDMKENVLGYCMRHPAGKIIRINAKYWEFLNDTDRHALIAHEMHHCYFGESRHHPDPDHYMHATMPWLSFNEFVEQLRYELFTRCKK